MDTGDPGLNDDAPLLLVGRIGRPHGVRGEVRVEVTTDFPERRFAPGSRLLLGREGAATETTADSSAEFPPVAVRSAREHGRVLLVRFEGIVDRTAAAALVGRSLFVRSDQAIPLEPGAYYAHQLVGCAVTTVDGRALGTVVELMETGSAEVLVIRESGTRREHLVPMAEGIISAIDVIARLVVVDPIPGLLD